MVLQATHHRHATQLLLGDMQAAGQRQNTGECGCRDNCLHCGHASTAHVVRQRLQLLLRLVGWLAGSLGSWLVCVHGLQLCVSPSID